MTPDAMLAVPLISDTEKAAHSVDRRKTATNDSNSHSLRDPVTEQPHTPAILRTPLRHHFEYTNICGHAIGG